MLEHEADLALLHRDAGGVLAVHDDAAGVGRLQPGDDAQQRRLAAARGAEQRDQFAVADVERHVAQRAEGVELLAEVADLDAHGRPLVVQPSHCRA